MDKKDRSKEPKGKGKVVKQTVPKKKEEPKKPEAPKGSEAFKETIKNHLRGLAKNDKLFLEKLKNPKKDINDCITYIINQVKASGSFGFPDEEIYSMAVHFYDENDIKVGNPISQVHICNNNAVMLTEDEISKAKEEGKQKVINAEMARMRKKPAVKKNVVAPTVTTTEAIKEKAIEIEKSSQTQGSLF